MCPSPDTGGAWGNTDACSRSLGSAEATPGWSLPLVLILLYLHNSTSDCRTGRCRYLMSGAEADPAAQPLRDKNPAQKPPIRLEYGLGSCLGHCPPKRCYGPTTNTLGHEQAYVVVRADLESETASCRDDGIGAERAAIADESSPPGQAASQPPIVKY